VSIASVSAGGEGELIRGVLEHMNGTGLRLSNRHSW
jgi:hypothetical protein